MKRIFLVVSTFLMVYIASAQLVISSGAQVSISGSVRVTLQNTSLTNNGTFNAGSSIISFTGNTSSSISGSKPVAFAELEINKTNNASVILQRAVFVSKRVLFSSGFLNLNGFNTDLGTTGRLDGENESRRITGSIGGEVLFSAALNEPTATNPANLGLFITSAHNLGNVTIKRGHQSQAGNGAGTTLLRYYDIVPTNNTSLAATLRFSYLNGELNGLTENALVLLERQNTANWVSLGFTSKDAVANFVEKTNINSLGRFTLSVVSNLAPVTLVLLDTKRQEDNVLVSWKTAQEQHNNYFHIERSVDRFHWIMIGTQTPANNSAFENEHSFTDTHPVQNAFYRIAVYGLDSAVHYSNVMASSPSATDLFRLWPNPFQDKVLMKIVAGNPSQALIKIFDSKGAVVKLQNATLVQGSNQLHVDLKALANGVYHLSVEWNNGQMKKSMQIIKQ
jgi:hypothetical protein